MTSLRRTVQGWMGDDLYQQLGDEPNIEITWKLLRDLIGQQLFGSEFVTVPYIESAIYYNQLFVIIKKRNIWSTFGLRPPTYKVVGNLDYLVNRDFSTWVPQFDFSPWDVADGLTMYREYKLRVASNRGVTEKCIDLLVTESHVRSAQPPIPGSLTIHRNLVQDLREVNTLYVITEVVFASFLKLSVRIGTQQKSLIYDHDIPIGFRYRKYRLQNNGTFSSEVPTGLPFTENEAYWLKPLPQPVPTVPRWDPMRRRYTGAAGRRKTRNNLTIPTPEEHRRSSNTGTWLREGGLVRVDRPLAHGGHVVHARDVIDVDDIRVFEDDDFRPVANPRGVHNQGNPNMQNRRSVSLDNIAIGQ